MCNIVFENNDRVICKSMSKVVTLNTSLIRYMDSLCVLSGTTYEDNIKSTRKLMNNINKTPLYFSILNDYLIPLGRLSEGGCFWFSAKEFLSCFEKDGATYLKFKDKMIISCEFSKFSIMKQYSKYVELDKIRKEKMRQYGFNL